MRPSFPTTLPAFARQFSTEEKCWDYLRRSRWPDGFVCPRDGIEGGSYISTRGLWECPNGHQTSVTSGTVMHRTKIPLCTWFWAAYLMATHTPGISAYQLARQLDLRYETAYMILQRLRVGTVNPGREKLRGRVEVDETYMWGHQAGKRGRGMAPGKSLVIAGVEVRGAHAGRVRLRRIRGVTARQVGIFLKAHIERGTQVVTDGHQSYRRLPSLGYPHKTIKGSSSVEVARQLVHIHRVFSNLKTWLNGTHHGVSGKHLQAYLNEFAFRFNRRRVPMAGFQTLLGLGSRVEGPTYEGLYRTGRKGAWRHPNPLARSERTG